MLIGWSLYVSHPGPQFPLVLTVTRLLKLQEVTCGLIYLHDQGVIHGDLKGVRLCTPQLPTALM